MDDNTPLYPLGTVIRALRSEILHGGSKMSSYTSSYGLSTQLGAQAVQRTNTINSISKDLNSTLQQLSTGYKFTSPSEDPSGCSELTRLQSRIYGVEAAISNNQYSFNALSGIDSAQSAILNTIMDMRSQVLDAANENDPDIQQALLAGVSAAISAINVYSSSVDVGGKKVLAGEGDFDMSPASGVITVDDSYIRSSLDNSYLSLSFNKDNAAEQAVVSGVLNLPDSGAGETESIFDVTTSSGTRRVQINATTPIDNYAKADALSAMNQQLADIGVYAELDNDGTQLSFLSKSYGDSASISYEHVSGVNILTGVTSSSDTGVTGTVMVNGKNYDIKGRYNNKGSESAKISGEYTDTITTDATINLTTTNGTISYAFGAGDTVSGNLTAMNTAFATIGAEASISSGELVFKTINRGNSEAILFSNTGTDQIFDDGLNFTNTGKDYENNDGLKTYVATTELQAELALDSDKVTKDLVNNVALEDQHFSFQPEGGVHFHISDGTSNLDSINYGFRDLSSSGLDLEKIVDNSSEFYMLDNPNEALKFLDSVISMVRSEWTGLGSFMKNNLEGQTSNLQEQLVSLAEQRSTIADVDEAYATTRITKLQLLQQANISAITVAGSSAKAMAALLPSG